MGRPPSSIILFCILLVLGSSCLSKHPSVTETKILEITDTVNEDLIYQLGKLTLNDRRELKLIIKNRTQTPIMINEVRRFCGCTIPHFDSEPIKPNESGEVEITYVADHFGIFSKSLKVYLSTQRKPFQLLFKGEVVKEGN